MLHLVSERLVAEVSIRHAESVIYHGVQIVEWVNAVTFVDADARYLPRLRRFANPHATKAIYAEQQQEHEASCRTFATPHVATRDGR